MVQLTDKVYAVEVPEGSSAFKIIPHLVRNAISEMDAIKLVWECEQITHSWATLPPGTWRFLFTTKMATEDDARKVVKNYGGKYTDYEATEEDYRLQDIYWYDNALQSLSSLLRSKGLDPDKNYALIEKL